MGKKYLIDSNTLIEYAGKLLSIPAQAFISAIIDEEFNISFINKIEVLGHISADDKLKDFITLAILHNISDEIIDKTIELRKKYKIKIADALIAATAIINSFTLITHKYG